ncbi:MAG: hypothetical protein NVS2B8_05210 [Vulcanimicrobiaceae bacterium]
MIVAEKVGEFPYLRLVGDFDVGNAEKLERALAALADSPVVIVSLEAVTYIDSKAIGVIFRYTRMRTGRLVVVGPQRPNVASQLAHAGFALIVKLANGRDDAMRRAEHLRMIRGDASVATPTSQPSERTSSP